MKCIYRWGSVCWAAVVVGVAAGAVVCTTDADAQTNRPVSANQWKSERTSGKNDSADSKPKQRKGLVAQQQAQPQNPPAQEPPTPSPPTPTPPAQNPPELVPPAQTPPPQLEPVPEPPLEPLPVQTPPMPAPPDEDSPLQEALREEEAAQTAEEAPSEAEAADTPAPVLDPSAEVESVDRFVEGLAAPNQFSMFNVEQIELNELMALSELAQAMLARQTLELSLQDCVHLALANNQEILIISYEPQLAFGDFISARGDFDPIVGGSFQWTDVLQSSSPQVVAFGGVTSIENYTTTAQLQVSGFLPWGTEYSVAGVIEYEEGTFSQFIGQYNSRVVLGLTQPLLRGFGHGANLARVRVAKNAISISQAQVVIQVLQTMGDVIKAYWDLVGAIENLGVRQTALANAERVVDINEKRLEIGMAAPIEVLQAKAGVAPRITDLVTARRLIADSEDRLKNLLSMRDGEILSPARIIPINRPSDFEFEWTDEQSIRLALSRRPEIVQQQLSIENAVIGRRQARTSLLPQLDVNWQVQLCVLAARGRGQ